MEDILKQHLIKLKTDSCKNEPREAVPIINRIIQCFKQVHNKFNANIFLSITLVGQTEILGFIWDTSLNFETMPSAVAGLKLLQFLITDFEESMKPYFYIIFGVCVNLMDNRFVKVRLCALQILRLLLSINHKCDFYVVVLTQQIEKYLKLVRKCNKNVSEQVLLILGIIFDKYPETVSDKSDWYVMKLCNILKFEIEMSSFPCIPRVQAAFEGMCGILKNRDPCQISQTKDIYGCIKKFAEMDLKNLSRNQPASRLLKSKWKLFAEFAYEDREFWMGTAIDWMRDESEEVYQCGFDVLCTFYKMAARVANLEEYTYFLQQFFEIINSEITNSWEKGSSLVGLVYFLFRRIINVYDLNKLYVNISNLLKKKKSSLLFKIIPFSVECLSALIINAPDDVMDQLWFLQRLSIDLINHYPKMKGDLQVRHAAALQNSFLIICSKSDDLSEYHINKVVYQGLIRICSLTTLQDADVLKESGIEDVVTYKPYISLWKYLIDKNENPGHLFNYSEALREEVSLQVFNAFVNNVLMLMEKLNLKGELNYSEGRCEVNLKKPGDVEIFKNMVDLFSDLAPQIDPFIFSKWIIRIMNTAMTLSFKKPFVAGFYKIMTTTLKIAHKINFFNEEREEFLTYLGTFLEKVLLRLDRYKSDLQTACLEMILLIPGSLIKDFGNEILPALEMSLSLGRENVSLVKMAMKALRKWQNSILPSVMNPIIERILPHFEIFLENLYFRGTVSVQLVTTCTARKELIFDDNEYLDVQKKLLVFLGDLKMSTSLKFIGEPNNSTIEWANVKDKKIIYKMPFADGTADINLSEMLPRVVELAMCCANRKTRITACESLHSMVMVLLDHIKESRGRFSEVFCIVFRACVTLASDDDSVIYQIFQPLTLQIVHYFAGKAKNFPEAGDVINILTDLVTLPNDPTTRDFAAALIVHFVYYTFDGVVPQGGTVPVNIIRIFHSIYPLTKHSSYNKRLGAAIIFNKLYIAFQNCGFIFDRHWFRLFCSFMECLKLCNVKQDVRVIKASMENIMNALVKGRKKFNKPCPNRLIPPGLEGNCLKHLVLWCLKQCTDLNLLVRRMSMRAVLKLAPRVQGCKSVNKFFRVYFRYQAYEIEHNYSEDDLEKLSLSPEFAVFDYYQWLLTKKIVTVGQFFRSNPNLTLLFSNYVTKLKSIGECNFETILTKRKSAISCLKCIYALRTRSCILPKAALRIVRHSLVHCSDMGFLYDHGKDSRIFFNVLSDILKFFSVRLSKADSIKFFRTTMPLDTLGEISTSKVIEQKHRDTLFAFRVMLASHVWKIFVDVMELPRDESYATIKIFNSLFRPVRRDFQAVYLNPMTQEFLGKFLELEWKADKQDLKPLVLQLVKSRIETLEGNTDDVIDGEYFQKNFKYQIFEYFQSLGNVLNNILEEHPDTKNLRWLIEIMDSDERKRKPSIKLAKEVLSKWNNLIQRMGNPRCGARLQKEKLLLQVALNAVRVVDEYGVLKTKNIALPIYRLGSYWNLKTVGPNEIDGIFSLLPYLSKFGENLFDNEDLKNFLQRFLVISRTFDKLRFSNTVPMKSNLVRAVMGLLNCLRLTASSIIFDVLLKLAFCLDKLISKKDVDSALDVFLNLSSSDEYVVNALNLAYDACFFNMRFETSHICIIYEWFLEPLLKKVSKQLFCSFLSNKILNLCDMVLKGVRKNRSEFSKTEIKRQMLGLILLESYFKTTDLENFTKLPKTTRVAINDFSVDFIKLFKAPRFRLATEEEHRQLMCKTFNLLCCFMNLTCPVEGLYNLLLFDDNTTFIYESIVSNQTYNLVMLDDKAPEFDNVSQEEKVEPPTNLEKSIDSMKYNQRKTIFESSVKTEATRFELGVESINPMKPMDEKFSFEEIEWAMDSLSSHECLSSLVTVLRIIHGEPSMSFGENYRQSLPPWLSFFLRTLRSSEASRNLKLFILKTIFNAQELVKYYLTDALPLIFDSVLEMFEEYGINYFLIDLIEMLMDWTNNLPNLEACHTKVTKLIEMVIKNIDTVNKEIPIEINLEILETMMSVWKGMYKERVLSSVLFDRCMSYLSGDEISQETVYKNGRICKIFLSNSVPPWTESGEMSFLQTVIKSVIKDFQMKSKINELLGEVCGMSLKQLEEDKVDANEIRDIVENFVYDDTTCGFVVFYGVQKYYPKMASKFNANMFKTAWNLRNQDVVKKLEALLCHLSQVEEENVNAIETESYSFLVHMVNSNEVKVQELSIKIIEKLLNRTNDEKVTFLVKKVLKKWDGIHISVRKSVYQLVGEFYFRRRNRSDYLTKMCKIFLLRGLYQEQEENEKYLINFWVKVLKGFQNGPLTPKLILKFIFSRMYTGETEDCFLCNAVKLLVGCAADLDTYKEPVTSTFIADEEICAKRSFELGIRKTHVLGLMSNSCRTVSSIEHLASFRKLNTMKASFEYGWKRSKWLRKRCKVESDNLFRGRFLKGSSANYIKWRKAEKEEAKEEQNDDMIEEKQERVDIFGDYWTGEYPDIRISHHQILKPLEVLAGRDQQIAKKFLLSFFSGLLKSFQDREKRHFLKELFTMISALLTKTFQFDSHFMEFILTILLDNHDYIRFDYKKVVKAARLSNNFTLGALIMEKLINDFDNEVLVIEEWQRTAITNPVQKWLDLATLYRGLKEFDVPTAILLDKLKVNDTMKEALFYGNTQKWAQALMNYESQDQALLQNELYMEACLTCLTKLSDWSVIEKYVRNFSETNLTNLWEKPNLVKWLVKSETVKLLYLDTSVTEENMSLNEICSENWQWNYVRENFKEEFAIFELLACKDLQRTQSRIHHISIDYLNWWSSSDRWLTKLRKSQLLNLQTTAELHNAVETLTKRRLLGNELNLEEIIEVWERNRPLLIDDPTIWDIKLNYRQRFVKYFNKFELRDSAVRSFLGLAKNAMRQGNMKMCSEWMKRIEEQTSPMHKNLTFQTEADCIAVSKEMACRKFLLGDNEISWYDFLGSYEHLESLLKPYADYDERLGRKLNIPKNQIYHLYKLAMNRGMLFRLISPYLEDPNAPGALVETGEEYFNCYGRLRTVEILRSATFNTVKAGTVVGAYYLNSYSEIASKCMFEGCKFCVSSINQETLSPELVIISCSLLLSSMVFGNVEARRSFGLMLNVLQYVPEECGLGDIQDAAQDVPTWMFLPWLNQILLFLPTHLFPFLKEIVERIAEDYPSALLNSLSLIKEKLKLEKKVVRAFVRRITRSLKSISLYEDFNTAIMYVAPPDLILRHHLEKVYGKLIGESPKWEEVRSDLRQLRDIMYSPNFRDYRGPVFKFWDNFAQLFRDMEHVMLIENTDFWRTTLREILESIDTYDKPSERSLRNLESYSPWLARFHSMKTDKTLELPGAYDKDGDSIKYVVSFKLNVEVVDSKRCSTRIGILASDGKEYKYVIRRGQSLRNEERIQQMFRNMNHILRGKVHTSGLDLETYKVVPMNGNLGMTEWFEDKISLRAMIKIALGDRARLIGEQQFRHMSFLKQHWRNNENNEGENNDQPVVFTPLQREQAVNSFKERLTKFPDDLLRKFFWILATSPQHFLYLRTNFATSHAVMCYCNWLLGLGDRRLEHIFVSKKTGRVLGTNFTFAFGTATQFISPPELIPFRLTPQIINLMSPLKECGWIKLSMIRCSRVFREEVVYFINTLKAVVVDPTLDWLEPSKMNTIESGFDWQQWNLHEKILIVKNKVNGANPIALVEKDLRDVQQHVSFFEDFINVVTAEGFRTKYKDNDLTSEEQVEALIDMATNYHALALTSVLWNPWL